MADLGLEHGLPACEASLPTASPGGDGVATLLGPQMGCESEHRTFPGDPAGLRSPSRSPDLASVCQSLPLPRRAGGHRDTQLSVSHSRRWSRRPCPCDSPHGRCFRASRPYLSLVPAPRHGGSSRLHAGPAMLCLCACRSLLATPPSTRGALLTPPGDVPGARACAGGKRGRVSALWGEPLADGS